MRPGHWLMAANLGSLAGFCKRNALHQLGGLEEESARLSPPSSSTAAEINNTRLGWVRVTNALVANSDLVGLDGDTDRLLFSALRAAERTADGRGRRTPDAPPAPAPAVKPASAASAQTE